MPWSSGSWMQAWTMASRAGDLAGQVLNTSPRQPVSRYGSTFSSTSEPTWRSPELRVVQRLGAVLDRLALYTPTPVSVLFSALIVRSPPVVSTNREVEDVEGAGNGR